MIRYDQLGSWLGLGQTMHLPLKCLFKTGESLIVSERVFHAHFKLEWNDGVPDVTYWPSTEPSIKRCTCVNKRKNSGSRWASNKNITRTQTAWGSWSWSQLETRCWIESQRQTEVFGPSVTHGWATPAKMRKKCCYGQKNLGQYVAVCSHLQLTSHTQSTSTLSRIKCERYIFIKKCVCSFIEATIIVDYVSAYICMYMYVAIQHR